MAACTDVLLQDSPFEPHNYYLREGEGLDTCSACTAMVKQRSWEARQGVWNRLPEMLGLEIPGWVRGTSPSDDGTLW